MRLREIRKSKKLTMKDIAKILNVSESAISQYENGKRELDYASLSKLADYFNVSVDYLLERTDNVSLSNQTIDSPNTITMIGRGSGKKTITLTDDEMTALQAMLDAFKKDVH